MIGYIAAAVAGRIKRVRRRLAGLVREAHGASARISFENHRVKLENVRLRRELKRLSDFIDTSSDVVWETDERLAIISSNRDLELPGAHIGPKLAEAIGVKPFLCPSWVSHLKTLANRESFRGFEISVPRSEDSVVWLEINGNPTFAKGRFQGYRGTYRDITKRKIDEARIAFLANHDPLTGLCNRAQFRELVKQALSDTESSGSVAVLCLDLDGFKRANDTFGHAVGDLLLRAVADRLMSCTGQSDTVARLGGDEFAILLTDLAHAQGACDLAERVLASVSEPYVLDGQRVVIGTSIGINVGCRSGLEAESFVRDADVALYSAKTDGRGIYRLFQDEMNTRLLERRSLESDLRVALAQGQFGLVYQPIVNIASKQIVAFEALLRWHHPQKGTISPATFIPLAEETALIVPIGEWVLQQACREAASWPSHIRLAVNLSPVQFKRGNIQLAVTRALAAAGLHGSRLELEITEGVFLHGEETTLAALHDLRTLGVQIAIDDFGIGYSGLNYLRNFPLDKIKIDQSFVRDLETPKASAIVRTIAQLGEALGMTIVAEGVETADQFVMLQAQRCTEAQGYFIAHPQPPANLPQLLAGLQAAVA